MGSVPGHGFFEETSTITSRPRGWGGGQDWAQALAATWGRFSSGSPRCEASCTGVKFAVKRWTSISFPARNFVLRTVPDALLMRWPSLSVGTSASSTEQKMPHGSQPPPPSSAKPHPITDCLEGEVNAVLRSPLTKWVMSNRGVSYLRPRQSPSQAGCLRCGEPLCPLSRFTSWRPEASGSRFPTHRDQILPAWS